MTEFASAANVTRSVLESRLLRSSCDKDQLYDLAKEIVTNQTDENYLHHVPGKYAQTSPGSFVLPAADPELLSPPPESLLGAGVSAHADHDDTTVLHADHDISVSRNVAVQGMVQNRRRFQGNITAVEVQSPGASFGGPGSTVAITGFQQIRAAQGVPLLWISAVELVRSSRRPSAVGHVVELLCEGAGGGGRISCIQASRGGRGRCPCLRAIGCRRPQRFR